MSWVRNESLEDVSLRHAAHLNWIFKTIKVN